MKKYLAVFILVFSFCYIKCYAQIGQVNILTYNVKPVLPADVNDWTTIPAAIILVVQPTVQGVVLAKPVFTIKQGSSRVCGNTVATANPTNISPTHNFTTGEVVGALSTCPTLAAGNYTLCVIFYNEDNREISKEVCKDFRVEAPTQEFCNPPQNIGPRDKQLYTDKDFLTIKVFNWSPFIASTKTIITYRLTVWEIEEGQSAAQAMYDNYPVLQEDVKGITRYTSRPSTWERRNATYVWRVEAIDQDGKPLCKTNMSEPTQFKIEIPEAKVLQDSTTLNTPCGNGDFESSILDPLEWSAGYTMLSGGSNSTFSPAFNNIMMPANGNPVDASIGGCAGTNQSTQNHHVIVSSGFDPNVPALRRTPLMAIPNNYALRLGNNCNGCGTERVQKKFVVTPGQTNYRFMYALVFEAPHTFTSNPSLWVRVFNASGVAIPGLVYLDPLSTSPMDRAVSDPVNPYWKTSGSLLYRDWACAKIDLSSLVGQQVTVEILTNDCAYCGHYGYGYFDNFCLGCDAAPPVKDLCCKDSIVNVSKTVNVITGGILNVVQNFTVSPTNIKQINAEIAYVTESASDPACRDCITNEAAVWNFMPINKVIWNSGIPNSGAPLSSTGMYPAQNIVWFCNAQGNLKLDLKIALPGIPSSSCKRKGKVGIRYKFMNTDCTTCEQYIIYDYSIN
jgi:hypothetical protein